MTIQKDYSFQKAGYLLLNYSEFIGRVSIQHTLTDHLKEGGHIGYYIRPSKRKLGYGKKILELSLVEARELGLRKVLVTCDNDNICSQKIIEANGGILENVVDAANDRPRKEILDNSNLELQN